MLINSSNKAGPYICLEGGGGVEEGGKGAMSNFRNRVKIQKIFLNSLDKEPNFLINLVFQKLCGIKKILAGKLRNSQYHFCCGSPVHVFSDSVTKMETRFRYIRGRKISIILQ